MKIIFTILLTTTLRTDSVLQFSVMVTSIFEDNKGNYWFGTHGDGLCRYDGKSFTRINNPNEQGISRSIFEDNSGRIWIPQNGLAMFYWENGELINFTDEYLEKYPKTSSEDLLTGGQALSKMKMEILL